MEEVSSFLEKRAANVGTVVVEPEVAGQGDCEGREGEGADEREKVVEDGDGFGEYEGLEWKLGEFWRREKKKVEEREARKGLWVTRKKKVQKRRENSQSQPGQPYNSTTSPNEPPSLPANASCPATPEQTHTSPQHEYTDTR